MKKQCAACHDDDEVLLTCGDGKLRCPSCMAESGWCLSCGSKTRPMQPHCAQCDPFDAPGAIRYGPRSHDVWVPGQGWRPKR